MQNTNEKVHEKKTKTQKEKPGRLRYFVSVYIVNSFDLKQIFFRRRF